MCDFPDDSTIGFSGPKEPDPRVKKIEQIRRVSQTLAMDRRMKFDITAEPLIMLPEPQLPKKY